MVSPPSAVRYLMQAVCCRSASGLPCFCRPLAAILQALCRVTASALQSYCKPLTELLQAPCSDTAKGVQLFCSGIRLIISWIHCEANRRDCMSFLLCENLQEAVSGSSVGRLLMIKGDFSLLFSYDSIEKYDFFLQTVWIL